MRFCTEAGLVAVPGTERTLTYFVAHLVKKELRLRTIKVYLSAVRFWHIAKGKEDPFQTRMVRLQYMLQGVKREEASRWHSPMAANYTRHLEEVESGLAEPGHQPCQDHAVGSSQPGFLWLPHSRRNDSAEQCSI